MSSRSFDQEQKTFALTELRGFLESVQEISKGLIEENADKIIAAAKKSEGSVIDHTPQGLISRLPIGFKKLGFGVNDLFDKLAESTEKEYSKENVQNELNEILHLVWHVIEPIKYLKKKGEILNVKIKKIIKKCIKFIAKPKTARYLLALAVIKFMLSLKT